MRVWLITFVLFFITRDLSAQDIISFEDGYITFEKTNSLLYYSIESRPSLSDTSEWSNVVSSNIQNTNDTATVPVGVFYRVVAHSNFISSAEGTAGPEDVRWGETFSSAEGVGLTGQLVGGTVVSGTFSAGGRWCDNGDGTITDMTSGLIWLKSGSWGGVKVLKWDNTSQDDAMSRVGELQNGVGGLTDGSAPGDWRLPTIKELQHIVSGTEFIQQTSPFFFTGLSSVNYWSMSTVAGDTGRAYLISMSIPLTVTSIKGANHYILPVRNP